MTTRISGTPLRFFTLTFFLVGLFLACANGTALAAASSVTVPIEVRGAHVSVPVTINGREAQMLLDTGADQTVFSAQAAERLGLTAGAKPIPGSGAAGSYTAAATFIDDLAVGSYHLRKHPAFIIPVPAEFTYDGVLGAPFIASRVVTLDYEKRLLTLQPGAKFKAPGGATPVSVRFEGGKLLVTATAAGVTGWYSVDTGAGNALTFFTPAVERHGLRTRISPSIRTITGVSPGGYTRGDLVRIPELIVGGNTLTQVMAELSIAEQGMFASTRYEGNLGGDLWRRFTVTLDYAKGRMYLVPNGAFADPFVGPRSGLTPSIVDGAVRIIDVLEKSPASEAGLVAGDIILAVNGRSLELSGQRVVAAVLEDLSKALKASPGTAVTLSIKDAAGNARDARLTLRELL